jgi:predicted thioesterase
MLEVGLKGLQTETVAAENTAAAHGSGLLPVFATPALVALMEKTCWTSVAEALEAGQGTVGTRLDIRHTAPTPVGMTVTCESELTAVEGRKLTFSVRAFDEKGAVGEGVHERFVIDNERFMAKAGARAGN